jgi:hypothetical protein
VVVVVVAADALSPRAVLPLAVEVAATVTACEAARGEALVVAAAVAAARAPPQTTPADAMQWPPLVRGQMLQR